MKFYGYIPTGEGKEPLGTEGNFLFELETVSGAIRKMRRIAENFKPMEHKKPLVKGSYKLFSYTNFYDQKTFKEIV